MTTWAHFYQEVDGYFDFPNVYREALARIPEFGSMVEVGVCCGQSFYFMAVEALNRGLPLTMFAVDPFRWPGNVERKFRANLPRVADPHLDIVVCKGLSIPISKEFEDASQDFIFIDAEHSYKEVKRDLQAWWPKLKPGGVFAGHDWGDEFPGVEQAVNEFCVQYYDELLKFEDVVDDEMGYQSEPISACRIIPCESKARSCWWIEKLPSVEGERGGGKASTREKA